MMAAFSLSSSPFTLPGGWRRGVLAMLVFVFLGGAAWGQGWSYSGATFSGAGTINLATGYTGPYFPIGESHPIVLWFSAGTQYSMRSATLSLPERGGEEGEVDQTAPIRVTMNGLSASIGEARSYTWVWGSRESMVWSSYSTDRDYVVYSSTGEATKLYGWTSSEGGVFLRWFWNEEPVESYAGSMLVGTAGTYRVELWQTRIYQQSGPVAVDENNVKTGEDHYRSYQMLDSMTFEGVLREPAPLAEDAPPQFLEVPDLPAAIMVPYEGLKLAVRADAGEPFILRWYRDGLLVGYGRELEVRYKDVNQAGRVYHCEARGLRGKVETRRFRLRKRVPVEVNFSTSVCAVEEGGMVRLDPQAVSETPVTYAWTGPALTAGYAGARVLGDGNLEITEARVEDAGTYFLTVTNAEATETHAIPVSVVRMPGGTYPLIVGEPVKMEGIMDGGYQEFSWQQRKDADSSADLSRTEWYGMQSFYLTVAKLKAGMEGEYHCRLKIRPMLPKSVWELGSLKVLKTPLPFFELASDFEMRVPWEDPVMPEHWLPVGKLGEHFLSPGPVRVAGAGSAAVRYQVSGLPRGLKALPDGSVSGVPVQGGLFPLKFVAVNKQGRSAPVEVMLSVIPLPEGVVGEWLGFSTGQGESWTMKINTTSLGTFTARGPEGPAVGIMSEYSGKVFLTPLRGRMPTTTLLPGTNLMEMEWDAHQGYAAGRGWRNVWSRGNTPDVYAGRYNFYSQPLASPREDEVSVEAGYRSGTALVGATGLVKSVVTGEKGVATTSGFFLGPQGQVLHEMRARGQLLGDGHVVLGIDETGQVIQGLEPDYEEIFKTPTGLVYYNYDYPTVTWPTLLERSYQGRRYTPPATGTLPAGYIVPEADGGAGANALLTLGLPEAALFSAPEGEATADAQAWRLSKGGRMRLTGPATHAATCKVHLPTGMVSGKVQFANSTGRSPKTKFQGYLIPQSEGGAVGYGATGPASGWDSLPVTLEAVGE